MEDDSFRPDIGTATTNGAARRPPQIFARNTRCPGIGGDAAPDDLRQRACRIHAGAGERDVLTQRQRQAHAIETRLAARSNDTQRLQIDAARGEIGRRRVGQRRGLRRTELFDDLIELLADVHALLIPVDQLLYWRRQVAIGRDDSDELADIERPRQRVIAADRIEQEGRHLREQIVEEFRREFPVEQSITDPEEMIEDPADAAALVTGRTMIGDLRHALDDLADAPREKTGAQLPFLAEPELFAPHARDDERLHSNHRRRHQPERRALQQDEEKRGQRLPGEKHRLDKSIADKAADRLHLVLDDDGGFRRFDVTDGFRRKLQEPRKQRQAQSPQQVFAELALANVDDEFERAVDEHQREKKTAERKQILQP